jgi:hypothetical protein
MRERRRPRCWVWAAPARCTVRHAVSKDRFTDILGTRRGSEGARAAGPSLPTIVRARALVQQLMESAANGARSPAESRVAEVEALAALQGLRFVVLATGSFAEGAVLAFELRDARDAGDRDWCVLLVWRKPGAWGLYTPDAAAVG